MQTNSFYERTLWLRWPVAAVMGMAMHHLVMWISRPVLSLTLNYAVFLATAGAFFAGGMCLFFTIDERGRKFLADLSLLAFLAMLVAEGVYFVYFTPDWLFR